MGFCSCINKTFLVILNFVVFAVGAVVIALASVVIHRASQYGALLLDGILTLPIAILVVGILITLLGFFGCCGAISENACMLYTYAAVVSILFVAEITLGVLVAVYPNKANAYGEKIMIKAFEKYDSDDDALKKTIDTIQRDLKCCGVRNSTDWADWNIDIPQSCCKADQTCTTGNSFKQGCHTALKHQLRGATLALGITGVVLAIIQVMCICISCGLGKKRSQYV